ncbi:hypothetical protein DM02DRAFT_631687 [Periconia macrospinosa]|uniref:Uncharacterized protein n=1 Tax=Periconia macrospinosa TaxID=97972 RepID=A0A2V1DFC0_9PLEO|nr:hypothetical protein DM02DRAFT_631687 [Periconia macrospinosa]
MSGNNEQDSSVQQLLDNLTIEIPEGAQQLSRNILPPLETLATEPIERPPKSKPSPPYARDCIYLIREWEKSSPPPYVITSRASTVVCKDEGKRIGLIAQLYHETQTLPYHMNLTMFPKPAEMSVFSVLAEWGTWKFVKMRVGTDGLFVLFGFIKWDIPQHAHKVELYTNRTVDFATGSMADLMKFVPEEGRKVMGTHQYVEPKAAVP